jgi:anti-sigma factor RsiW
MWCRTVRIQLSAYADGELSLGETRRMEEHLAHCKSCAEERAKIEQVVKLTALIPSEEVPARLHHRIVAKLGTLPDFPRREVEPRPAPSRMYLWPAFGGAAALTGAAAALALGIVQPPVTEPLGAGTPQARTSPAAPASGPAGIPTPADVATRTAPPAAAAEPAAPAEVSAPGPVAEQPRPVRSARTKPSQVGAKRASTRRASGSRSVTRARRPAPAPEEREAAPAPMAQKSRPIVTDAEAAGGMSTPPLDMISVPGDPMINSTPGAPMEKKEPEKEPSMRMAGAPLEVDLTGAPILSGGPDPSKGAAPMLPPPSRDISHRMRSL